MPYAARTYLNRLVTPAAALLLLAATVAARVAAQTPAPADEPRFEVVSIKPFQMSPNSPMGFGSFSANQFRTVGPSIRFLITAAYEIKDFQLAGGPSWINTDLYEIVAKIPEGAPRNQVNAMLRTLFKERFLLQTHTETRQVPVFRLMLARKDGRLGAGMRPTETDCAAWRAQAATPGKRPEFNMGQAPPCGAIRMMGGGRMSFKGLPVSSLMSILVNELGGPVMDQTGLSGDFDIDLEFASELMVANGAAAGPEPTAPTLRTALQEQLGLKIESQKGPVEFLVIDSIQKPTEN